MGASAEDRELLQGREEKSIDVLRENWNTVAVFRRCKWDFAVGMAGVLYLGIPTPEIVAVAAALKVDVDANLIDGVRVMESVTRDIRNP